MTFYCQKRRGRRRKGERKRSSRTKNLTTFNYKISTFNRHHRRLTLKLTFKEKDKEKLPAYKGAKMELCPTHKELGIVPR